jgi:hypothetical protein
MGHAGINAVGHVVKHRGSESERFNSKGKCSDDAVKIKWVFGQQLEPQLLLHHAPWLIIRGIIRGK